MPNPSITIIGLEGCGKTVLMTVLAKKLAVSLDNGCYLDPIGTQTIKRVESTWATLQRGEWPPSTPPGEMFSLRWKLIVRTHKKEYNADLRLIDLAGQDTRQLFNNDDIHNETREHLKPLADYITHASIVLLILNIKDFVGEVDDERRIDSCAVIKSALDQLMDKKVLVVFTQLDQYEAYIQSCGGLDAFCQKQIPYIYNAHIKMRNLPVQCVAAVNDTQVKVLGDGRAIRVPRPNFSTRGVNAVIKWLIDSVEEESNNYSGYGGYGGGYNGGYNGGYGQPVPANEINEYIQQQPIAQMPQMTMPTQAPAPQRETVSPEVLRQKREAAQKAFQAKMNFYSLMVFRVAIKALCCSLLGVFGTLATLIAARIFGLPVAAQCLLIGVLLIFSIIIGLKWSNNLINDAGKEAVPRHIECGKMVVKIAAISVVLGCLIGAMATIEQPPAMIFLGAVGGSLASLFVPMIYAIVKL